MDSAGGGVTATSSPPHARVPPRALLLLAPCPAHLAQPALATLHTTHHALAAQSDHGTPQVERATVCGPYLRARRQGSCPHEPAELSHRGWGQATNRESL